MTSKQVDARLEGLEPEADDSVCLKANRIKWRKGMRKGLRTWLYLRCDRRFCSAMAPNCGLLDGSAAAPVRLAVEVRVPEVHSPKFARGEQNICSVALLRCCVHIGELRCF